MQRRMAAAVLALTFGISSGVMAQTRPAQPPRTPAAAPAADGAEIKLDESTNLKATALEARMSAVIMNYALLQRQAQDLQQEMAKMLDERKRLLEDAGKKAGVDVKNSGEWAFDSKAERYVHRPAAATPSR